MGETAHTPGPWKELAGRVYKPGENGANICSMSALRASTEVGFTEPEIGSPNLAEICANARLISAAPDLLAACKDCLEGRGDWMALMFAAIAKAESRS